MHNLASSTDKHSHGVEWSQAYLIFAYETPQVLIGGNWSSVEARWYKGKTTAVQGFAVPYMCLIMKAKLTTPPKPDAFLVDVYMTKELSRSDRRCWNSLAMKLLGEKLISWNHHFTEFRLSGVGSPCWLAVHRVIAQTVWAVMPWQTLVLVLMRTATKLHYWDMFSCIL